MTIENEVDLDITNNTLNVTNEDNDDDSFIIVVLVVIVCVIAIIVGFFIVRLCMSQRQRKVILEETKLAQNDTNGTARGINGHGRLNKQESQPRMDEQYVAESLDYLELTKKQGRKQKMQNYGPLPDNSMRGSSENSVR